MGIEPRLADRLLPYSLGIFGFVVGFSVIDNGLQFWNSWRREYVLPGIIMIPLFAAVIWLRWDWAPYVARKRSRERNQEFD
jgi:hypothetical protein